MRIAEFSYNLECGGIQAMISALSVGLSCLGQSVDLICLDAPTGSAHEQECLAALNKHGVTATFLGRERGGVPIAATAKLWYLEQRTPYDILHSHWPNLDALIALVRSMSISRSQHVITVHSTRQPRHRLIARCGSRAHVVYCSEAVRRLNPAPGITATVIPNGIAQNGASSSITRTQIRHQLGIPDSSKVVIAVGRLSPEKNFGFALNCIAALLSQPASAELRVLFCGEGPEERRLKQSAADLKLDGVVSFLGSRTDVRALLSASDIFLSTSLFEGLPLAVLEALSDGLPCVLSSIEEHVDIAQDLPGCIFVSTVSTEGVAKALRHFIANPPCPGVLADARAPMLSAYSIAACSRSYFNLYTSVRTLG